MKIQNAHNYGYRAEYANADNIEVYKDTLLRATQYVAGYTKKIYSSTRSGVYRSDKEGRVFVENIDTVGAIVKYDDAPACVLNMASGSNPGGGVAYGAKAQEEALFRCSNLGLSISRDHYPLISSATLYTTDVVFFKDKDYNFLPDGHLVDVITSPAVKIVNGEKPENYEELTDEKISLMLDLAAAYDQDYLILGAWGCGVYKNDPQYIAETFKKHLEKKRYYFKKVIFAIINDQNSVGNNYSIFKSIL